MFCYWLNSVWTCFIERYVLLLVKQCMNLFYRTLVEVLKNMAVQLVVKLFRNMFCYSLRASLRVLSLWFVWYFEPCGCQCYLPVQLNLRYVPVYSVLNHSDEQIHYQRSQSWTLNWKSHTKHSVCLEHPLSESIQECHTILWEKREGHDGGEGCIFILRG